MTYNQVKIFSIIYLILALFLLPLGAVSQESSEPIPDVLRIPERGEAPRYPDDLVIGQLGQGEISEGAYLFAQNILSAVVAGQRNAAILTESGYSIAENYFDEVRSIRPRNHRLGGGRIEVDGCVSFLVRIIGPEESITGELLIRQPESSGGWILDDLILEDKRALSSIRDSYRYDFTPYERFF